MNTVMNLCLPVNELNLTNYLTQLMYFVSRNERKIYFKNIGKATIIFNLYVIIGRAPVIHELYDD